MVDHPTPNRLLILWALQEEYLRTVAPARRDGYLSIRSDGEVAPPPEPDPTPRPTAEDVPLISSTQAAYEVFSSIDQVLGEADDVIESSRQKLADARLHAESAPFHVEYRVTLRHQPADRGVELAFGVGVHATADREALLPRFLVVGDDGRAGQTLVRAGRAGGAGVTFCVSMIEYCAMADELRAWVEEFAAAADLPLPDGWLVGPRTLGFLRDRVAATPLVADGLRAVSAG